MNFEQSIAYIEDYMVTHGPFDALLGFSHGAFIVAASPRMQAEGVAFTKVPKIKFVILIAGAKFLGFKFGQPKHAVNAFSSLVQCPSLHIIGPISSYYRVRVAVRLRPRNAEDTVANADFADLSSCRQSLRG
ncbi:alpha/beta-Hydrolases superfamily protein [Citrus sinensis]|uniref:Alpha/beta-Hydrolases superfamily protein n=1 Tax=Citrus sinensis TaxID=2711 RepID=A0ACB8KAP3_CITSI|nr:alpha/beta-Hydrolases superfamily protein [Citrus sinensis]